MTLRFLAYLLWALVAVSVPVNAQEASQSARSSVCDPLISQCNAATLTRQSQAQSESGSTNGVTAESTYRQSPAGTYQLTTRPSCAENGSCYGDISATTGRAKTTYVNGYTRKDGTYVRGHYRSKR
jgi:hypothetical protein